MFRFLLTTRQWITNETIVAGAADQSFKVNASAAELSPCAALPKPVERRIERLSDRVYCAIGYALSNVAMIAVNGGKIIVDATESLCAAREIKLAFDQLVPGPVKCLILTHSHPDHILGAAAFHEPGMPIWAHANFVDDFRMLLGTYSRTLRYRASKQFGDSLPANLRSETGIGPALRLDDTTVPPLLFPTHTFRGCQRLEMGGVVLELHEAPGETRDHLFVHLPDERTILAGDNVYRAFPNLYAVRGTPPRPVVEWTQSLDKMRWLEPDRLVLGHTEPICGRESVQEILTAYRDAIAYLHSAVIRMTDRGFTPDEMVNRIQLPDHLRDHPYLAQTYGKVEWGIRGIYEGHVGWFDGNATKLHELAPEAYAERLIGLAGGLGRVEYAIETALAKHDAQWAAQLCDVLLAREGENLRVRQWKARALEQLAAADPHPAAKNYYLSSAAELRGTLPPPRRAPLAPSSILPVPLDMVMQSIPLQLRPDRTANMQLRIGFEIPDAGRCYTFYVRNGVGEIRPDVLDAPDFTIRANEGDLKAMFSGMLPAARVILRGAIRCTGGMRKLNVLRTILQPP